MDEVLRPLIKEEGQIPFRRFMELALYHEDHGYYSDPARTRVGRSGDFATNVSVGPAFGSLLALRLRDFWRAHGTPATLPVFELGPEDGSLALDILSAARRLDPDFHAALRYHACEHSDRKRATLAERFAKAGEDHLHATTTTNHDKSAFGVVLANEVLDALPVDLVRFENGEWHFRDVTLDQQGALSWCDGGPADAASFLSSPKTSFPEGYQTEFCPLYPTFLEELSQLFDRGLLLFIDYGFTEEDYYHPDRTTGTLQTYAQHHVGDNPLDAPGQRDLTAHVNFSAVEAEARRRSLQTLGFARQESYLTHLAAPLLQSLPDGPESLSFIRQFRTLTHPGFFGSRFHVLELAK